MTRDSEIARAVAFFASCDDVALLRRALAEAAPKAAALVRRQMHRGGEASIPTPSPIRASAIAATEAEAMKTLQTTSSLADLQALTRAIGRRVESLEPPEP